MVGSKSGDILLLDFSLERSNTLLLKSHTQKVTKILVCDGKNAYSTSMDGSIAWWFIPVGSAQWRGSQLSVLLPPGILDGGLILSPTGNFLDYDESPSSQPAGIAPSSKKTSLKEKVSKVEAKKPGSFASSFTSIVPQPTSIFDMQEKSSTGESSSGPFPFDPFFDGGAAPSFGTDTAFPIPKEEGSGGEKGKKETGFEWSFGDGNTSNFGASGWPPMGDSADKKSGDEAGPKSNEEARAVEGSFAATTHEKTDTHQSNSSKTEAEGIATPKVEPAVAEQPAIKPPPFTQGASSRAVVKKSGGEKKSEREQVPTFPSPSQDSQPPRAAMPPLEPPSAMEENDITPMFVKLLKQCISQRELTSTIQSFLPSQPRQVGEGGGMGEVEGADESEVEKLTAFIKGMVRDMSVVIRGFYVPTTDVQSKVGASLASLKAQIDRLCRVQENHKVQLAYLFGEKQGGEDVCLGANEETAGVEVNGTQEQTSTVGDSQRHISTLLSLLLGFSTGAEGEQREDIPSADGESLVISLAIKEVRSRLKDLPLPAVAQNSELFEMASEIMSGAGEPNSPLGSNEVGTPLPEKASLYSQGIEQAGGEKRKSEEEEREASEEGGSSGKSQGGEDVSHLDIIGTAPATGGADGGDTEEESDEEEKEEKKEEEKEEEKNSSNEGEEVMVSNDEVGTSLIDFSPSLVDTPVAADKDTMTVAEKEAVLVYLLEASKILQVDLLPYASKQLDSVLCLTGSKYAVAFFEEKSRYQLAVFTSADSVPKLMDLKGELTSSPFSSVDECSLCGLWQDHFSLVEKIAERLELWSELERQGQDLLDQPDSAVLFDHMGDHVAKMREVGLQSDVCDALCLRMEAFLDRRRTMISSKQSSFRVDPALTSQNVSYSNSAAAAAAHNLSKGYRSPASSDQAGLESASVLNSSRSAYNGGAAEARSIPSDCCMLCSGEGGKDQVVANIRFAPCDCRCVCSTCLCKQRPDIAIQIEVVGVAALTGEPAYQCPACSKSVMAAIKVASN
uniref:Uncharacterized protein n=1 Tax=Palpitomonas bilix TaxID=652834 RepID=A0A7S3DBX4_9EUKA|mmetsp:Transcript_30954/g.81304  ORF Transcript_30954/g.81304 Transcript_30954/m.81304 type:complete len:1015 (+) Transcript_30954:645-3689(+)